jgi:hypothetical protein
VILPAVAAAPYLKRCRRMAFKARAKQINSTQVKLLNIMSLIQSRKQRKIVEYAPLPVDGYLDLYQAQEKNN